MKNIILSSLFLSIICIGCSVIPSQTITSQMNKVKKEGMIVGTISLENRKLIATGHYFFYANDSIRNLVRTKEYDGGMLKKNSTKYNYGLIIQNNNGDFREDGKWIFLYSIKKPAGKYNFYEIEIFLNSGYMQSTWKMPIEIPFEVEEGKIKYLGELNLNVKNGTIRILDKIDRDRAKFKELYPSIVF